MLCWPLRHAAVQALVPFRAITAPMAPTLLSSLALVAPIRLSLALPLSAQHAQVAPLALSLGQRSTHALLALKALIALQALETAPLLALPATRAPPLQHLSLVRPVCGVLPALAQTHLCHALVAGTAQVGVLPLLHALLVPIRQP